MAVGRSPTIGVRSHQWTDTRAVWCQQCGSPGEVKLFSEADRMESPVSDVQRSQRLSKTDGIPWFSLSQISQISITRLSQPSTSRCNPHIEICRDAITEMPKASIRSGPPHGPTTSPCELGGRLAPGAPGLHREIYMSCTAMLGAHS